MPIIKSAKKAARQAEKRTEHNVEIKKAIKAALKAFRANPNAKTLSAAQSEYDKAVKKDLMKKNTAARQSCTSCIRKENWRKARKSCCKENCCSKSCC